MPSGRKPVLRSDRSACSRPWAWASAKDRGRPMIRVTTAVGVVFALHLGNLAAIVDQTGRDLVAIPESGANQRGETTHEICTESSVAVAPPVARRGGLLCAKWSGAGAEAHFQLRLRPAADHRVWHRSQHLRCEAEGTVGWHLQHQPVSWRAARPGAADAAETARGRHRFRDYLDRQRIDARAAGGGVLAALPVP